MSFLFEALSREECEAIRAEDGYIEGHEAGLKEGLDKGRKTIVVSMKRQGLSDEKIAELTELSMEEIEELLK